MGIGILVTATTFPTFKPGHVTPPFVYELSRRLVRPDQAEVIVSTPFINGAEEIEQRDGILIHRFRYGFSKLCDGAVLPNIRENKLLLFQVPFLLLFSLIDTVRWIRTKRIGVIHAHWIVPQGLISILARVLCARHDIRIVCTCHGADVYGLKPLSGLKRWILRRADAVTVVSSAMKRELEKHMPRDADEIRVVPMGVDTHQFSPAKTEYSIRERYGVTGPLILFVGRLAEKKGVRYLLEALPPVSEKFPDARVLIVGSGPLESELKAFSEKLGLQGTVVFTGAIANDQLPAYYATADVFVGPSIVAADGDREGLPVSFMEAMAAGCIVVATDLEGMDDLVEDGVSGFIVRQRNAEDIADRIIRALSGEGNLDSMKDRARAMACERFDWEIISGKYRDILIGQSSGQG